MRIGYRYLGAVWPSISDCEEIALSVYQERLYEFAIRRIMEGKTDWRERLERFDKSLKNQAIHKNRWSKVIVMD